MRIAAAAIASLVLVLSGCSVFQGGTTPAVWELAPGQVVDAETRTMTVLVKRVSCNNGVTGTVNDPALDTSDDELVITFTVSPGEQPANCEGNDLVAYVVELDEPLGDRRLVDGSCRTTEASETVFCDSELR